MSKPTPSRRPGRTSRGGHNGPVVRAIEDAKKAIRADLRALQEALEPVAPHLGAIEEGLQEQRKTLSLVRRSVDAIKRLPRV